MTSIHIQLQVRQVNASDYKRAKEIAFELLCNNDETYAVMVKLNAAVWHQFNYITRVAKEADGSFTVTVP